MINLVSFKSSQSEEDYLTEFFNTLTELILELRYDVKDIARKVPSNLKSTHFNIFMKNQYKIDLSPLQMQSKSSTKSLSINFFLQKKEDDLFLQVESWNFYIISEKKEKNAEISNLSRAKICLFLRSVLCLLTSLPLWRKFICLPDSNPNKKQFFIDHELLINAKEKEFTAAEKRNLKENFIEIETENFFLIFKVVHLVDFTFLPNEIKPKPKLININVNKIKRERFLSEGTCEDSDKTEGTPLRFFAQWGIEGDISHKKVPNHFKIQQAKSVMKSLWVKGEDPNENKDEIEVIDSENDVHFMRNEKEEDEENNQFELITEETELKKQNSDYQIIGMEKNSENLEKIIVKCKECMQKIIFSDSGGEGMAENLEKLKQFARALD